MSPMLVALSLGAVAVVALIAGVALCAFRRIRRLETCIRAPLQRRIDLQAESLRKVQDVSAAHDLFLAGLSHELRTPLSGIRGAVQLLQNTRLNDPQREYTRMISYASATVLEIVDDMLTYSRMQAGKIHIESVSFSVREMIDDMLALQSIKAQERGIVLIRDVSAGVPPWLSGDRGKLNQILLNLIGNAIKFTEEGTVTVSVDLEPDVKQRNRKSGSIRLRFMVSDTGIGVAANEITTIFEPFTQGHAASRSGRQGTGLGLTICQRLLHAMGGDIHLDSVLHVGTCVTFYLDLDYVDVPALSDARTEGDATRAPRSLVVLVVEDDEINRLVCTRYLALAGHHPVAAADEQQVQHLMEFSGNVPDVILMDVNLAGQSGVELALQISTMDHGRWQAVPIIAMSADVSGTAQERAAAGGISVFLPKPFSARQLCVALDAAIQNLDNNKPLENNGVVEINIATKQNVATKHYKEVIHSNSGEHDETCGSVTSGSMDHRSWLSETVLLDEAWLTQEIDVLGTKVMFELLNIFRVSAATTLKTIAGTTDRQDWQATADQLHRLQGSAANLGMQYVVSLARALQAIVLMEGGPHPVYMSDRLSQLEAACYVSADSLRALLLAAHEQGVAFTAQGND